MLGRFGQRQLQPMGAGLAVEMGPHYSSRAIQARPERATAHPGPADEHPLLVVPNLLHIDLFNSGEGIKKKKKL